MKTIRIFAFAALIAGLTPSLDQGALAFELFPRPMGQYTVKRGDTLYGIAGLYYANPALWPFLWNQNPHVKIDPNNPSPEYEELAPDTKLNIHHQRFSATAMNHSYHVPTGLADDTRFLLAKIPYKGIPYDKKYFRYKLSQRPTKIWGYIVGSPEQDRFSYVVRDLVYIRLRPSKKQCILVGDRLGVFRESGPVNHPVNQERQIGFSGEVIGEVEIISTGHELATGIILDNYTEIERGDKICLFVPRPMEIVPSKTHRMITGTILRTATRSDAYYLQVHHLENDIVFTDRGECDGLKEGTLVNIYRPTHPFPDPHFFGRRVTIPDRYVGEGMILKAFKNNSTMLITRTREEVLPGDVIKSVSDWN
jgi:hypothetical protein